MPAVKNRVASISVLAWCTVNALITTVHHVHGAMLYNTPERYEAVVIAAVMLGVVAIATLVSRVAKAGRPAQKVAWWIHGATALLGFVIIFGAVEGLYTHIIFPITERGYTTPGEPFDLLFQVTGMLHVVPAAVTAVLLWEGLRLPRGRALPNHVN